MNVLDGELVEGRPKHMITIGQLANHAGVTIKAVRHYHQRGLLDEPPRDASGYRRYSAQHAIDLIKIKTLAEAGVPLARIKALFAAERDEFAAAIAEKRQSLDDPEFRAIYLEYDAAFDWSSDDPRLNALAERAQWWIGKQRRNRRGEQTARKAGASDGVNHGDGVSAACTL